MCCGDAESVKFDVVDGRHLGLGRRPVDQTDALDKAQRGVVILSM